MPWTSQVLPEWMTPSGPACGTKHRMVVFKAVSGTPPDCVFASADPTNYLPAVAFPWNCPTDALVGFFADVTNQWISGSGDFLQFAWLDFTVTISGIEFAGLSDSTVFATGTPGMETYWRVSSETVNGVHNISSPTAPGGVDGGPPGVNQVGSMWWQECDSSGVPVSGRSPVEFPVFVTFGTVANGIACSIVYNPGYAGFDIYVAANTAGNWRLVGANSLTYFIPNIPATASPGVGKNGTVSVEVSDNTKTPAGKGFYKWDFPP